ncbi:MAG TPA: ATP-binding protein [Anaeromyxobacter sp.]|nr:ATP-binding protein [Anaeromyxobacter sp.]
MSLGIKTRIVLVASGAMTLALGAITAVSGRTFHEEYKAALQSRSLAIATSLEVQLQRVLQLGLALEELIGFEEQCQEAVRAYEGIEHAMVIGRSDTVLFHSDARRRGQRIEDPGLLAALRSQRPTTVAFVSDGRAAYGAVAPILDFRGARQASVVVVVPASVVAAKARQMAISDLGVALLFVALGMIALVAALSALVTHPLAKLIHRLNEMRHGTDLSRRLAVPATGDIGRLAGAFNGLLEELQRTTVSKEELERAMAVLREAEERYRRLVITSPSAIFVDRGDGLVFVNSSALALLGAAREEHLHGRRMLELVHPDSRGLVEEHLHSLRSGAQTFRARDVKLVRLDGALLDVELTGIAFAYDGAPAAQLVVHDLTERKAMQAQLVAAGRLASLGALARGVAHEINNPLSYVISGLDQVATDLAELSATVPDGRLEETMAALADARHGANQVRYIVNDLQVFSRDRDRLEPVEIHRSLDLAVKMASSHIRYRARLVKDYAAAVPRVMANEARLGQVFVNLLVNAGQALPEGRPEENEVRVVTRVDEDGRAVVEVQDTGCGIPAEIRDRIFDPFFTTKQVGAGTGLGLFISHGIVKAMGGEIAIESEVGRGTRVRVVIPVASAQVATVA